MKKTLSLILLSTMLTACGGESSSSENEVQGGDNTPSNQESNGNSTNNQNNNSDTQTAGVKKFGLELAAGYKGTYKLSCKNKPSSTSVTARSLVIDKNGKVSLDGKMIFEAGNTGSATIGSRDNAEYILFSPSASKDIIGVSIEQDSETKTPKVTITGTKEVDYKSETCGISAINLQYFTQNISQIFIDRLPESVAMPCYNLTNPLGGKKTHNVMVLSDGAVQIDSAKLSAEEIRSIGLFISVGSTPETPWAYNYTVMARDGNTTDKGGLSFIFDQNDKLKIASVTSNDESYAYSCSK